jgi:Domain of unknown function (DUF4351)
MHKPYDTATKEILGHGPNSWMAYLQLKASGPIRVIDANLAAVTAEADKVYRVCGRGAHLVHVELQSKSDRDLPRRLWRYNAMLDLKHGLRVRSVALLLRPEADHARMTGILDLKMPDGDEVVSFFYKVVRAWEQPVQPLLAGDLWVLPMAPLADVPRHGVPEIIERVDSRLASETIPATAGKIMAATLLMAWLRRSDPEITDLRRRLRTMSNLKESSFYQVLLKEGREEGRKEGEKRGQIAGAQKLLFHLGRSRLGPISKKTRAAVESINDLTQLERLGERLLEVSSWAELLAEPG